MTRILLKNWLVASYAKYVMSPRVKAPALNLTTRTLRPPEVVRVPTRHGRVRCYVQRPHPDAVLAVGTSRPPVYINFHGGGFILTNPRMDDTLVGFIAAEVGAVVVNVDYATAPQVRYPVGEEQAYDVLCWAAQGGDLMGWDGNRIGIGGGSAGAKLALAALQLARSNGGPTTRAAVLVVPPVDVTIPPEQLTSALAKPMVDVALWRAVQGTYFVEAARRAEPLASPALDADLKAALPPTLILAAEYDTLTPTIDQLVARLIAEDAALTYRKLAGVDHGSLALADSPRAIIDEGYGLIRDHLTHHLR